MHFRYALKVPPYGIFTSAPTARICTETPNLEETFYFLVCVHKLVNGTHEGAATRGALAPLLPQPSGVPRLGYIYKIGGWQMNRPVMKPKNQKSHIRYVTNVATTALLPVDHPIILKHKTNHNMPTWRCIEIQELLHSLYYFYTKRITWKKYKIC